MGYVDSRTGKTVTLWNSDPYFEEMRLHWEAACKHPSKERRTFPTKDGRSQIYEMCLICGAKTGNPLKFVPDSPAPPFDPALADIFEGKRAAERERILHKHIDAEAQRKQDWDAEYEKYRSSPKWKELRRRVFERSGGLCEGCRNASATEVHHLTYRNVGDEFLFQLVAICDGCHRRFHEDEKEQLEVIDDDEMVFD